MLLLLLGFAYTGTNVVLQVKKQVSS
jgi:hypothetical protein